MVSEIYQGTLHRKLQTLMMKRRPLLRYNYLNIIMIMDCALIHSLDSTITIDGITRPKQLHLLLYLLPLIKSPTRPEYQDLPPHLKHHRYYSITVYYHQILLRILKNFYARSIFGKYMFIDVENVHSYFNPHI